MFVTCSRKYCLTRICGLLATIFVAASPAKAEVEEITIAENATFKQEASGVEFSPKMGRFERDRIVRYHTANDVSASYTDTESATWATIYVTRVGTPDVSLWFHRVAGIVAARGGFEPHATDAREPTVFVAPGFDRPSAIRIAYPVHGSKINSTGIAMIAYGDLIVKIRVSSEYYTAEQLDQVIDAFVAMLKMPEPWGTEPHPYVLRRCDTALIFDAKATLVDPKLDSAIEPAILSLMSRELAEGRVGTSARQFCVDSSSLPETAIYRPAGSLSSYIISQDDTGRATVVGTATLGFGENEQASKYSVSVQWPDQTFILRSFDRLPTPQAALDSVRDENILGSTDRKTKVNIATTETDTD